MCDGASCEAWLNGWCGQRDGADPLPPVFVRCITSSHSLARHLGMLDGRMWVGIHDNKLGEFMMDVRRLGDAAPGALNSRELVAEFRDAVIDLLELCTLCVGGRRLAANFGRFEVTMQKLTFRDVLLCFRIRPRELEGIGPL